LFPVLRSECWREGLRFSDYKSKSQGAVLEIPGRCAGIRLSFIPEFRISKQQRTEAMAPNIRGKEGFYGWVNLVVMFFFTVALFPMMMAFTKERRP
jgi:hypothetical protein